MKRRHRDFTGDMLAFRQPGPMHLWHKTYSWPSSQHRTTTRPTNSFHITTLSPRIFTNIRRINTFYLFWDHRYNERIDYLHTVLLTKYPADIDVKAPGTKDVMIIVSEEQHYKVRKKINLSIQGLSLFHLETLVNTVIA